MNNIYTRLFFRRPSFQMGFNTSFPSGSKVLFSIFLLTIFLHLSEKSWGQTLSETFNYTFGGNLGGNTSGIGTTNNNWTTHSNSQTGTINVVSGSLTFSGISPSNNRINIPGSNTTTPRDINRSCGLPASQNTTYYSFLLNVTDATQLSSTFGTSGNSYFVHLSTTNGASAANFTAKVHIRSSNSNANYRLGVSETTNIPNEVTGDLTFGNTYLIVLKYVYNNTPGNDLATMWVNPISLGGTEPVGGITGPGSGNVTSYNSLNTGICIRNSSATPKADIDEIRVGTTWAQVTTQNVDAFIVPGEYGTHTNGQNQQTNGGNVTYMNWDANNLYVGVSGPNLAEGYVLYLDKDPQVPVDGGTNANGTLVGQNYDGANFAGLPFRADLVLYVKTGYREYRTANGSNGWSAQTTSFGLASESGSVREFSIPWSVLGGMPASFNWFSFVTSATGFVYSQTPTENAGGFIGASARYERYYTVSTTTIGSATPPFSRNSFVFNNTADENSFGAISVYDFTMNSAGRFISRTGATTQNWTIAGNLVVGAGTIYFGSGGTNGAYGTTNVSGNLDVRGGTLDMDQTTSSLNVAGSVALTSGTLKLSGNAFGGGDIKVKGNWSKSGGATFTPMNRAVFFDGSSGTQALTGATTFDYVIVDKSSGNLLVNDDITVNQTLTLTNGIVNMVSPKTLSISTAGSTLVRTNGWVSGNLQRAVATGASTVPYFIGDLVNYAPTSINFSSVGTGGFLTASTVVLGGPPTAGTPPSGSGISQTKYINRLWTLTNNSISSPVFSATFDFINPGDIVGGAIPANLIVAKNSSGSWTHPGVASTTSTSVTTVSGLTSFSDFYLGEAGCVNSTPTSFNITACDSYTLPWGGSVSTSGAYSNTYTNAAGCDSMVTANVTINYSNSTSFNATACNSYELPWGGTVTISGAYSNTYSNAAGCDSLVTANVTINYSPVAVVTPANPDSLCFGVPVLLSEISGSAVSYQWYNFVNPIAGETNSTYIVGGNSKKKYKVVITDINGCTDTSNVVDINRLATPNATILVVNPDDNPDLCINGKVKLRGNGASGITLGYQWKYNGNDIIGATNRDYIATVTGNYRLTVTNMSTGCSKLSAVTTVFSGCKDDDIADLQMANLNMYPNPTDGRFMLQLQLNNAETGSATVEIFNALGQSVLGITLPVIDGELQQEIHLNNGDAAGLYFVRVMFNDVLYNGQIVYQH